MADFSICGLCLGFMKADIRPKSMHNTSLTNMMPEFKKSLGRATKTHRERLNWTQEYLAGQPMSSD
jgi:hypothetical protein